MHSREIWTFFPFPFNFLTSLLIWGKSTLWNSWVFISDLLGTQGLYRGFRRHLSHIAACTAKTHFWQLSPLSDGLRNFAPLFLNSAAYFSLVMRVLLHGCSKSRFFWMLSIWPCQETPNPTSYITCLLYWKDQVPCYLTIGRAQQGGEHSVT